MDHNILEQVAAIKVIAEKVAKKMQSKLNTTQIIIDISIRKTDDVIFAHVGLLKGLEEMITLVIANYNGYVAAWAPFTMTSNELVDRICVKDGKLDIDDSDFKPGDVKCLNLQMFEPFEDISIEHTGIKTKANKND